MSVEISERALEQAAHELYAAGPWGEFDRFLDGGVRVSTDGHSMPVYRDMVREAAPAILEDRVEAVAREMYEAAAATAGVKERQWPEVDEVTRAYWIALARRPLGLGVVGDGKGRGDEAS